MTRPMFPHTVDSTMIGSFRSCKQKMFRSYVEHWKPQTESVHLVAGGAFAKGVEVARRAFFDGQAVIPKVQEVIENGDIVLKVDWITEPCEPHSHALSQELGLQALIAAYGNFECPSDSAKSCERMAGALEFYYERYPFDADGTQPVTFPGGRSGIEFSFAEPLSVLHPTSGAPILYTGRSDLVAHYAGGIFVFDEKTTSQLGASWPRQWEMRSQFTGYIWAARKTGLNVTGAAVRGVSILKTKYDTLQHVTYRSQYELERWEGQVERDLRDMIRCWEEGYWDWNLDHSCSEYGGCSFVDICKSPEPERWLPVRFEQRVWDPLARKELSVEDYEKSWGHVREDNPPVL